MSAGTGSEPLRETDPAPHRGRRPPQAVGAVSSDGKPGGRAAVFLDRDGVINDNARHVNTPDDFRLLQGTAAAIGRLNAAGLAVVVVTNQGGIAMGYLTRSDLEAIHERMVDLLATEGAHLDAIYYCPYMPDATVGKFRQISPDRKPGIGMLEHARDDLGLDLAKCFLVGDSDTDILAGQRAGCVTIFVGTDLAGQRGIAAIEADHQADDLTEAVGIILDRFLLAAARADRPAVT